jgi:hypothetical protein
VALVDQPGPERLGGEAGAADAEIGRGRLLSWRTASGSKSRSIRVRALEVVSRVLE